MRLPQSVIAEIASTHRLGKETEEQRYEVPAQWFDKEGAFYLLYEEPVDQLGQTRTTMKIDEQGVLLIRHGDIEMRQLFRPGERTQGNYQSPHGRFTLETYTLAFSLQEDKDRIQLIWSYQLQLNEENLGEYRMEISVREDARDE